MKKLLLPFFLVIAFAASSQTNNSWIDYSKTYYKFKIPANGLYRINQPALPVAIANTPAEQFQLWRNGQQVVIYTSVPTGALGSAGFIEFWGLMNDGKKDTKLYRDPSYQLSDHWSLETDTASYFLTANTATAGNLRFTNAANNVTGTTLTPEPYFMNTVGNYYRDKINPGYAAIVGDYVYSSSYDIGEGWTSNDVYPGYDLSWVPNNMNIYNAGPSATLKIGATGNALNGRDVSVKFFNNVVIDTVMNYFTTINTQVNNIPLSYFLSPDFLTVAVSNTSSTTTDRMSIAYMEVNYPSKFNFNNQKNFSFVLPATTTGNYLIIDNFNYSATAPVLFDLSTNRRYTGDLSTAGKVKFVLPSSSNPSRQFVLVSEDASNINAITSFKQRNFINYSITSNQGNYLIITNATLFNNGAGINYVDQYRAYRSSTAGGGHNAKVYDIDELTDQFGFGIKKHPLAIKDFLQFAKTTFTDSLRDVFLIGKGVTYDAYRYYESNPNADKLNLVPTYGAPASDILLSSPYNSEVPDIPVGRISAVNGNEVGIYLNKMQEYELNQASTSQTVADKGWMKNIVHLVGGANGSEDTLFKYYLDTYKTIIEDTLFGAKVETFSKSTTAAVQNAATQRIEDLFNQGLSFLKYFGHSSASTLAFNLSNPETYTNQGKYPFIHISGCTAGDIFVFDESRLTGNFSLSEKYIFTSERGSIAFLASTHLGIPPFLHNYNTEFYNEFGVRDYGKAAGYQLKKVIQNLDPNPATLDYFTRMQIEQMTLHGDPALKINYFAKPDYVVEEPMIKINPAIVSVANNAFNLQVQMMNIGKAINDSIRVIVKRKLPNDSVIIIYNQKILATKYLDSLSFTISINPITDKGTNRITVILDADNKVDELSEINNTAFKDFVIFEDEVRPVYPYNYSIMNQQNISFYGSTANPLTTQRQIVMELDTTELFNSAFKKAYNTTSVGGVIQFSPTVTYTDSTVYYWRIGMTPLTGPIVWNNSSFVYLANSSKGFNQSHYYQHLKSTFNNITYNGTYSFSQQPVPVSIATGNYPPNTNVNVHLNVGSTTVSNWGNAFGTLQFVALNPRTLDGLPNRTPGLYNSNSPGSTSRQFQFEYDFNSLASRNKAITILDSVPNGYYVFLYNLIYNPFAYDYVNVWKTDAAINGGGISLYNRLIQLGFTKLDSFTTNLPFIFIYKKGDPSFTPQQMIGSQATDLLQKDLVLLQSATDGTIESPVFGPAKSWKALHWRGKNIEPNAPDSVKIQVFGIDNSGNKIKLAEVGPATDTTLAFINAAIYPNLTLKMLNSDPVNATPNQLNYWRINADYVPEGAVAPNIVFKMKDTVELGQNIDFAIAFKNISEVAFDSLKVKFIITDRNNVPRIISIPKKKALIAGDTLTVTYTIDTRNYAGLNTLYVDINPDNDQVEQYHFNNFIYKNFFVSEDKSNPLLDVTFDGVHILNRDIVSARPHIVIKLKDESKYLALSDTSLLKVQVVYPNGVTKTYRFDNDTLRFTPANLATGTNTATLDFTPLLPGNDDEYELIVSGKDVAGNTAGEVAYHVDFRVISKPMISNLLNYPNPFTTSTAFVFTVTGTDVPQNMRIQILTITGKIVREITKNELGPLHIGRNITDFKWDGTDMYGQKLANGVYLYRVLTNLNGKSLDKFQDGKSDDTDKYFTKGYGKMYLMR